MTMAMVLSLTEIVPNLEKMMLMNMMMLNLIEMMEIVLNLIEMMEMVLNLTQR